MVQDSCWEGLEECLKQKSNYINFKECYMATCGGVKDLVPDLDLR
jgi:hypothetical protein